MTNETEDVAALIEAYQNGWARRDASTLQSIWDPEYETVYCPSESARPIVGKAAIDQYFDRVFRDIREVHFMTVSDLRIDIIERVAYAFFSFHIEGETTGGTETFIVRGRNTLIAHRTDDGWKGIHYHESLQGPLAP
ncbi:nuclear transport factor 2 family protein [Nocardia cyriacigeorgica]|uniref:Nuclear transport factor 2 family protein n=1 Tax=Nocardia cyriacigeorgica TaxID=135487 RepID=A0A6P1DAD4_9NOCA|nr:nuclear transport factor 2 family protein [Nocardia cyriacigeorgica]NEW39890.1 nuclear transport factor 2 family protein [Nocardia cyriacigeorgica]NEW45673.1 nuclear transport factor 2 family protein [Nocardia cyriacigeorgica]NEW51375.1 nuclear transport factor 2 family protein [Nocardia cyriacigeorgica]NEW55388.1 nuclear transport factor 2 family protein [Nocardia cyriacigeorgica]